MKYIQKNNPPKELSHWKAKQKPLGVNYDYDNLPDPPKTIVHDSLLQEQGYICCYCCCQIKRKNSHIEHLEPQSQSKDDPALTIDYTNLLASCGSQKDWPDHCGNKRKNLAIKISPLKPTCESFFKYEGSGRILPLKQEDTQKEKDAEDTIKVLGLNNDFLIKAREETIDFLQETFENLEISEYQKNKLAEKLLRLNEGKYEAFCPVISYYLKNYYSASK